jgi:predicted dehydrogenase
MTKTLKTLVIGAGDRGNAWMQHAKTSNAGMEVIAVADTSKERRLKYANKFDVDYDKVFESGKEALDKKTKYDAVIIATPDATHRDLAVQALNQGYNVLLEKPMANTEQGCRDIVAAQKDSGTVLSIGHVLRYSDFFKALKDITDSGELGRLQDIDMTEEIANWHFAHSYVRGNWKDSNKSSPIILAKSCHDLDIISWLANSNAKSVNSEGSLRVFTPENAPKEARTRCTSGCPVECQYDARKVYLGDHTTTQSGAVRWPYSTISVDTSEEARKKAIQGTDYGKCVYMSRNNQPDNQNVSIDFENGVRANFRLRAWGNLSNRNVKLYFENGEVSGDLLSGNIKIQKYHGIRDIQDIREENIKNMNAHGGGDPYLIKNFADMIRNPNPENNRTSAELSLQSHLIGFAAEESRLLGKRVDLKK